MSNHEVVPHDPHAGPSRGTMLHPATGVLILGLDWALFSGTVFSAGVAMWLLAAAGFALGTVGAAIIQRRFGRDSLRASLIKGLLSGVAVGVPLPIAGTAVGGWILAASGLDRLRRRPAPPAS